METLFSDDSFIIYGVWNNYCEDNMGWACSSVGGSKRKA
jgi:hypothetical protein